MTGSPSPAYASFIAVLSPPLGTQTTAQVRAGPRLSLQDLRVTSVFAEGPFPEGRACRVHVLLIKR